MFFFETYRRIELVLVKRLLSAHPTMCNRVIRFFPNTAVLPCGIVSQTLDVDRHNVLSAELDKDGRSL